MDDLLDTSAIDQRRVALLFARAPIALLAVLVNTTLLAWLMWGHVSSTAVLAWAGTLWLVTLGRAAMLALHRRAPQRYDARTWERAFAVGAAFNGVAWGVGGLSFVGPDVITTIAVVFVVGGMVAGASSSTSVSMLSFGLYSGPALAPVVLALILEGGTVPLVLAAMLSLFGLAMTVLARQGGAAIVGSMQLEQRNAALLDQLRVASEQRSNRLRLLLEQAGVGVLAADPDTLAVLEVSDNVPTLLGLGDVPIEGRSLAELGPLRSHQDRAQWRSTAARARQAEQIVSGIAGPVVDGSPNRRTLELSLRVRTVEASPYLLAVLEDVTERKALEAALLQSSVLASLGTMAAGVAHEVNNPLGYILANLHTLSERLAPPSSDATDLVEAVDECIVGARRIQRIVEDLTSTARSAAKTTRSGQADVDAILEACLKVAAAEIRDRAQVIRSGDTELRVTTDPIRLNQVFLNLLLNAAHAIPKGDPQGHRITIHTARTEDGQRVRITITDTGCGIHPDVLPRVFEPFFTTKDPGEGTGLGLSICHALVAGSGGTLTATSTVDHGTTMHIELPVSVNPQPAQHSTTAAPPRPRAAEPCRVLVVDDELLVRRSVERLLSEHQVVGCADGTQALTALQSEDDFDLILCDLMMAGMNGMELHEQLARHSPQDAERVVFMTGGAFTERSRRFLERVPNHRIGKPFDVDALRQLAASMAGSRTSAAAQPDATPAHTKGGGAATPPP